MTNKSAASIRVVSTGIIYRNPKPYLRAVHTWHPTVALLKNGELLAAFDCGQGAESLDYRSYLSRSTDGGKTWSATATILRRPSDSTNLQHRADQRDPGRDGGGAGCIHLSQ